MAHPAQIYNEAKQRVFSLYHSQGITAALNCLSTYLNAIPVTAWYGLNAEIRFYDKYRRDLALTPSWDFGIKADFTGNVGLEANCRIDVTTNANFKHVEDFDPLIDRDGFVYKLAVVDKNTGELKDIINLNFPYNKSRNGHLLDVALFMPADFDEDGCSHYNYYQQIVTFDTSSPEENHKLVDTLTDWYIPDIVTEMSNIAEGCGEDDIQFSTEFDRFLIGSAEFLSKATGHNIIACGQTINQIIDPRTGDTEKVTKLFWRHPVIKNILDEFIYEDFSEGLY